MPSKELLEKMKQHYSEARHLAKEMWITMDNEGNNNDYYYFECGFVAGLNYQRLKALEELSELDQELEKKYKK